MKTERFSIVQGNAFDLIKQVKDKSVDLILTDPPYNIGKYSRGNIKFDWRPEINNDIADWDKRDFNPKNIADDFVRVLKPNGNLFIFCSYNLIGQWYEALDHQFDTTTYMFFKNGFLNSCELLLCCWNKKHKWNFTVQNEMHNFFESPICAGKERLKDPKHPTQKPIALLQHIIRIASDEEDLVFDPFMGVGSTGKSSLLLNRKFAGIEIDETYYNATKKRLLDDKSL